MTHAQGHLRQALHDYMDVMWHGRVLETAPIIDGEPRSLGWVARRLWNCTDIMPSVYCDVLDLQQGSSYAQGVRVIKDILQRDGDWDDPESDDQAKTRGMLSDI